MTASGADGPLDEGTQQLSHTWAKLEGRGREVWIVPREVWIVLIGGRDRDGRVGALPNRAGQHARHDHDVGGCDLAERVCEPLSMWKASRSPPTQRP